MLKSYRPRHAKTKNRVSMDETRQFAVADKHLLKNRPVHGGVYYFSVTFMSVAVIAAMAAALLTVDFRGRQLAFGENDSTVAFSNDSEGLAQINVLGREMNIDYAFALPAINGVSRVADYAGGMIPATVIADAKLIPQAYIALCGYIAEAVSMYSVQ